MDTFLKRNSAWQLLQTVAATGSELAIVLAFAATLSAEEFGRFAVALSGTKLIYLLFDPRIHEFLTPKLARYLDRSRRGAWMWVNWSRKVELILNLAAFFVTLVLASVVPWITSGIDNMVFLMCGLYNGCNALMKFSSLAIYRCIGDVRTAAVLSVGASALKFSVVGIGLLGKWPLTLLLLGLACVAVVNAVLQVYWSNRHLSVRQGASVPQIPRELRAINRHRQLQLMRSNYFTGLVEIFHRELDVQIAAWFGGISEAGRYRIAKTLAMVMLEALNPVVMVLLPDLSRRVATHSHQALTAFLRIVATYLAAIALVAGLALAIASSVYFAWFATEQYGAKSPLLVLVLGFAIIAPGLWAQVYLLAAGMPQVYLRCSIVGAIFACGAAIILVPQFGAVGSAIGHAGGLVLTTGLAVWASLRMLRIPAAVQRHSP